MADTAAARSLEGLSYRSLVVKMMDPLPDGVQNETRTFRGPLIVFFPSHGIFLKFPDRPTWLSFSLCASMRFFCRETLVGIAIGYLLLLRWNIRCIPDFTSQSQC